MSAYIIRLQPTVQPPKANHFQYVFLLNGFRFDVVGDELTTHNDATASELRA